MKITPLYHNVLIMPMREGDKSKGGLVIPSIATKKSPFQYGEIVAVGAGRITGEGKQVPLDVKAGEIVMFVRNAGNEVPVETDTGEAVMVMIEERYILGKVTGLKIESRLMGLDGRLLEMEPVSRTLSGHNQGALHDSSYKNQDELDRAQRDWNIDTTDHVDEDVH